ncbi:MAG TPA: GspE/PulE family protein [Planctomycetota bacterium]|nr:GspE/PulE family protein [Planctomycetota bacterium]
MATKAGLGVTRSQLDAGRKKIAASLKDARLEDLYHRIPSEMSSLLGAGGIRFFLRDPLTEELYARTPEASRIRETRVAADPSSVVGYAAMTRKTSFAWKRDPTLGEKRYVVAVPVLSGGDLAGVMELTHGAKDAVIDEDRLKIFNELVLLAGKRLQEILSESVRATPYDYLLESGAITRDVLRRAREQAAKQGRSVEDVLLTQHRVDKVALGRSLAEHFECPFSPSPADRPAAADLLRRFSPEFLRTHAVLPVGWKGDQVEVIVVNPHNLMLVDDLGRQLGTERIALIVAVREDILGALDKVLAPAGSSTPAERSDPTAEDTEWEPLVTEESGYDLAKGQNAQIDSKTIRLVNDAIQSAVDRGASDIHFETTTTGGLSIRFRVDGICHEYMQVQEACARPVVSRLKIMSQLNIAEHRLPQDGKIRLKDKRGRKTDLRVAIMPTHGGNEDVVLRLLPEYQVLKLDQIGMERENLERFRKVIEQPHGIVLCVGPTGSGKTTTLHAALAHVKGPTVKVWTAEDPIEITQEGIRQVQMHAQIGLTFERALRAFLRCDPDVVMIGEIRDRETADAAVEASLTGHLVMSTLHTNSAPETVTRLLEMGLDSFTFGSSLLGVLAQRLVRRICDRCAESYSPAGDEFQELKAQFGDNARFEALKVDRKKVTLARGKGCEACFDTGYRGRVGIHEFLVVTPAVRKLIQQRAQADGIGKAARDAGMLTLKQDGIRKVLKGQTDLKEVVSITLEENL